MRRVVMRAVMAVFAGALVALAGDSAFGQDQLIEKVQKALPDKAPAQPKQPRKLLVFSKTAGFRHDSIPIGIKALTMLGDKTGAFTVVATEDPAYFEPEKLKNFDAVLMLNTTMECLRPKTGDKAADEAREEVYKKSLVDFVASGKGLAGVHAATDTYHNWKEYNKMIGGTFDGHPWHKDVPIKNLDPKNPINAAFYGKDFDIADEIYQFRADTAQPSERRMLLSLDTAKMDVSAGKRKDGLYPISWIGSYGKGKTFYCS